jgi:hypothetical protein
VNDRDLISRDQLAQALSDATGSPTPNGVYVQITRPGLMYSPRLISWNQVAGFMAEEFRGDNSFRVFPAGLYTAEVVNSNGYYVATVRAVEEQA